MNQDLAYFFYFFIIENSNQRKITKIQKKVIIPRKLKFKQWPSVKKSKTKKKPSLTSGLGIKTVQECIVIGQAHHYYPSNNLHS